RPAQVGGDHHGRARIEAVPDRRDGRADAGVVGDPARVVLRHVEVGANEHAPAGEIQVGESLESHDGRRGAYFAFISATVVSSIRLEKPHSLSYQLLTLTRRPLTLVRVSS